MISSPALRGYLLEEALAWILCASGYRLLVHESQDPDELEDGRNGLCVKGRGANHQVDVLGEWAFTPPFSLPVRLFLEAKFPREACGLGVVRNAYGVIHDINENFGRISSSSSQKRYRYVYTLFSTSGFTVDAQRFASAQQISLVDLSGESSAWLREKIKVAAGELLTIQEELQVTSFPIRWMRGRLREILGIMPDLPDRKPVNPEPGNLTFAEQATSALGLLATSLKACQPGELSRDDQFAVSIPLASATKLGFHSKDTRHDIRPEIRSSHTEVGRKVSPANSEPDGDAAACATRPYWLARPCPPWCLMTVPHQDHDLADDRFHMSVCYRVDLTLESARTFWGADSKLLSCEPAFLTAMLLQHYRERDPHIVVTANGETDIPFTVVEGSELEQALRTLVNQGQKPALRNEPCPPWCLDHFDAAPGIPGYVHIGDYTMVTLTLDEHEYTPALPEPEQSLDELTAEQELIYVRLEQSSRELEARVVIVYRDKYLDMTLAEAQELTGGLTGLLELAGRENPIDTVPPPSA